MASPTETSIALNAASSFGKDARLIGLVGLTIADGQLVIHPKAKPCYTLAERLAASDYSEPQSLEEREWVAAPSVGGDLI